MIAINEAIIAVEELGLPNTTYAMQKNIDGWARPQRATLLVHDPDSLDCFPNYSPRIIFDSKKFGLNSGVISGVAAAYFAKRYLGCNNVVFVSFDSCVDPQQLGKYVPGKGIVEINPHYTTHPKKIKELLGRENIEYTWLIPKEV